MYTFSESRGGGGEDFKLGYCLSKSEGTTLWRVVITPSILPSFLTHQETCGPVEDVEDEKEEREDEEKNVVNFAPDLLLPLLPQLALLVRQLVPPQPALPLPQGRLPH